MSATGHHIAGAILLGAAVAAGPAQAQLPLSIEELLVEQRTLKLQTAFSYSNSDSSHPAGPGSGQAVPPGLAAADAGERGDQPHPLRLAPQPGA